jgi:hypothetical protein
MAGGPRHLQRKGINDGGCPSHRLVTLRVPRESCCRVTMAEHRVSIPVTVVAAHGDKQDMEHPSKPAVRWHGGTICKGG